MDVASEVYEEMVRGELACEAVCSPHRNRADHAPLPDDAGPLRGVTYR